MKKQEILTKCKDILNSNPIGMPLGDSDFKFLSTIFPLHPRFFEKCEGRRIKSIVVRNHPRYHSRQFSLVFDNGSEVSISYIECVNRNLKNDIEAACSEIIKDIERPDLNLSMVVREWLKGFTNESLTIGLYLIGRHFQNPALISNFRSFYSQM